MLARVRRIFSPRATCSCGMQQTCNRHVFLTPTRLTLFGCVGDSDGGWVSMSPLECQSALRGTRMRGVHVCDMSCVCFSHSIPPREV